MIEQTIKDYLDAAAAAAYEDAARVIEDLTDSLSNRANHARLVLISVHTWPEALRQRGATKPGAIRDLDWHLEPEDFEERDALRAEGEAHRREAAALLNSAGAEIAALKAEVEYTQDALWKLTQDRVRSEGARSKAEANVRGLRDALRRARPYLDAVERALVDAALAKFGGET